MLSAKKKTRKCGCIKLRVIRKKSVELQNTKVERISKYVLVVTKRNIAVIALYL